MTPGDTGRGGATGGAGAVPHGVLVVDKPPGMTSHDVVAVVRRGLGGGRRRRGRPGVKVGHAGTLDPDATGVLVVCVGKATRLTPYLQASRKGYAARLTLGATTTTLDAGGEVVSEVDASGLDRATVAAVLEAFVGEIRQVPPMVSARRVGGERLYVKARRGEVVEREARAVTIHEIVLRDFTPGDRATVDVVVTCSAGTYIRTLAADVGERLGVGGHLARLQRFASGRFSLDDAVGFDEVRRLADDRRVAELLRPMAEAVSDLPSVVVGPTDVTALTRGQPLAATGLPGPVAVLSDAGDLVAMVGDRDGAARPLAVLAEPGGRR